MTNKNDNLNTPSDPGPPPRDQLDAMLRTWHEENAQQAALGRDRLVRALAEQSRDDEYVLQLQASHADTAPKTTSLQSPLALLRNIAMNPYSRLAASLIVLVTLVTLFLPTPGNIAYAQAGIIMLPEGGKLEARDEDGNLIGPCPLKNTDVNVEISGLFSRVTIKQTYQNPYQSKIEAQYTFPMSHGAAVDRMTMTVGDRVVIGEVKEREEARKIYQAARQQGYVASLLEQERPNIFTQSVANIEPQAQIIVEISYVEVLESKDGEYSFDFPMVVGPRYIPGASMTSPSIVPAELRLRHGINLRGPARLTVGAAGDIQSLGSLQTGKLNLLLSSAQPIAYPGNTWWGKGDPTGGAIQPTVWYRFEAEYSDKSKEFGQLYTDGTGEINGRWFYTDPAAIKDMGTGFSQNTNQVPDASRITPEPVKPGVRAGHNISLKVTIDTGGPGIVDLKSMQHKIDGGKFVNRLGEAPSKVTIALANEKEIPNRDFVLNWRTSADTIQEAKLTHAGKDGGFFTLILQPPDRVLNSDVGPRELVFVMDTSGSMSGFPIEKSKEVINKAIDAMRDGDTFNVITFAGSTSVLWSEPQPATAANRAEAQNFITSRSGGGGTEMMTAINEALIQKIARKDRTITPEDLTNLPADGRSVVVDSFNAPLISTDMGSLHIPVRDGLSIQASSSNGELTNIKPAQGQTLRMHGTWDTRDGQHILHVTKASVLNDDELAPPKPMRIVLFLTDGYVGNDMAIIDAVKKNAHTTRVFSFGIGNSVNRWLLQGMANTGRGEAEFVLLESDSDDAVKKFTRRIETPVLTDIKLAFSDGLEVMDVIPPLDAVPDLFDVKPLIIHGRYSKAGAGTLTIAGNTGSGKYERKIDLEFALDNKEHDVISTLWARARVEQIMNKDLRAAQENRFPADLTQQIVSLGQEFQIMTQFTSFVAVEKSRVTIGGQPVLVAVPIEMPDGVSYEGIFGQLIEDAVNDQDVYLGVKLRSLDDADGDGFDDALYKLGKGIRDKSREDASSVSAHRKLKANDSGPGIRGIVGIDNSKNSPMESIALRSAMVKSVPSPVVPASELGRKAGRKRAIVKGKKGVASGESLGIQAGKRAPGRIAGFAGGSIAFSNAPELDLNSALNKGQAGSGGFGGGGARSDIARKNEKGGTITFPLQQAREAEGRYGYDESRSKSIRSGAVPLMGDIPLIGDLFQSKGEADGKILSVFADLPSDESGDDERSSGDSTVGGEVNVYRELKNIAQADKLTDASDSISIAKEAPEASNTQPTHSDESVSNSADSDEKKTQLNENLKGVDANQSEQAETQTASTQIELPLLTHLFARTGRPMLANEIAIIIGQFANADELVVASQLTNELIAYLPGYERGKKMRGTFNNQSLDDEQKKQAVVEIATQAYNELRKIMFAAYVEARLQNVLEDSLYQKLAALPMDDDRSGDRTARSDKDVLLVSVLLTSVDAEVIESLEEIGFTIIAKPKGNSFVVGEIKVNKIASVALLDAVRWVEFARITRTARK